MKILPLSTESYQVFPETDGMIEISSHEYEGLKKGTHRIKNDLSGVELKTQEAIESERQSAEAEKRRAGMIERIAELKKNLAATDYKTLKYAEGRLSIEEFEAVKVQRVAWREEINSLENLLEEK